MSFIIIAIEVLHSSKIVPVVKKKKHSDSLLHCRRVVVVESMYAIHCTRSVLNVRVLATSIKIIIMLVRRVPFVCIFRCLHDFRASSAAGAGAAKADADTRLVIHVGGRTGGRAAATVCASSPPPGRDAQPALVIGRHSM